MAVVTPTDRPKLVHNRCVVEAFGGVFVLIRCLLGFFCGCRGFVIGQSQISSLFSSFFAIAVSLKQNIS